jgi:hypothetical protein
MATPGMQGEVSPESTGKNSLFSRREPARREAGLSPHYWEHYGPKSAKTLHRKAVRAIEQVGIGKSKRKSGLNRRARSTGNGDLHKALQEFL